MLSGIPRDLAKGGGTGTVSGEDMHQGNAQPPNAQYSASGNTTRPKRSKWLTIGLPIGGALFVFLLGSGVGSSDAQAELGELRQEKQELAENVASSTVTNEQAAKDLEAADALKVSLELQMQAKETEISQLKEQVIALQTNVQDLQAQAQAQAAAVTTPNAFAAPAPQSASAYFSNCDEARAAGAAPVRVGDPGYGRHLDRDGDGVGCE